MFLISYLVFLILSSLLTSIQFRPKKGCHSFLHYLADDFPLLSFPRVETRGYKYFAHTELQTTLTEHPKPSPFGGNEGGFLLPHFQGYNGQYSQHNSNNPETGHDFCFGNALFLKMMMDRTHQENTASFAISPFGIFKICNLNYD